LPLAPAATMHNAISDGEDYELLFAISARDRTRLEKGWRRKFPKLALTRIGNLTSNAKRQTSLAAGYIHFQSPG